MKCIWLRNAGAQNSTAGRPWESGAFCKAFADTDLAMEALYNRLP